MLRYIIRRLLWVVVLLFVVSLLTFVIFYVLPSADPAALRAGRQPTPQLVAQIRHNLGLDEPVYDAVLATTSRASSSTSTSATRYQNNVVGARRRSSTACRRRSR